jgi:hypothetical protein
MPEGEEIRGKGKTNAGSTTDRTEGEGQKPIILVDVANVAYGAQVHGSKPRINHIRSVLAELGSREAKTIAVADASLRHIIDDKASFETFITEGRIQQVPAGTDADDLIWSFAKRYRNRGETVHILTNDKFPYERAQSEGVPQFGRIAFMFVEDELVFQPPLDAITRAKGSAPPEEPTEESEEGAPDALDFEDDEDLEGQTLDEDTLEERVATEIQFVEQVIRKPTEASGEVAPELLQHLTEFFAARKGSGGGATRVNFATVAHFLHATYGGNFCARFGYKKPKELALALESGGYAKLSHHTTTLYIEPTDKLFEYSEGREA